MKTIADLRTGVSSNQSGFNEEIKIAKTMVIITTGFVVFWSPHTIRFLVERVTQNNLYIQEALEERFGKNGRYAGKLIW